jgi:Fur family ferric uptake transcriptional regulator
MPSGAVPQRKGHLPHQGHDHTHSQECGHQAVAHESHVDYLHDGHRHTAHLSHWDECSAEVGASAGRATWQGAAVNKVLATATDFRSAQEIHAELRGNGQAVGLTTVYRHLQTLADAGEVDVLRTAVGEATYSRCTPARHHHHLVCRVCRRTVEVEGPEVEAWAHQVAAAAGFRDIEHVLEITGTCPQCAS